MNLIATTHPRRVLFHEWPPRFAARTLRLAGARGETVIGVAAFRLARERTVTDPLELTLTPLPGVSGVQLRIAQPVPVILPSGDALFPVRTAYTDREWDSPTCLPDPLWPADLCRQLASRTTYSVWVTASIDAAARPGTYRAELRIRAGRQSARATVSLTVWNIDLPQPQTFSSGHWIFTDSITRQYGCEPFTERWWGVIDAMARNMADHRHTLAFTPALHPSLNSTRFDVRMQLVDIHRTGPHRYRFDLTRLDRWVDLFARHGIRKVMLGYLASQWGATHSSGYWIDGRFVKPQPVSSRFYRELMRQWLPAVQTWARRRGLIGHVYQAVSDEPKPEQLEHYRALHAWLRALAPDLKWMEACNDPRFGELLDAPVPIMCELPKFKRLLERKEIWTYYCTGPRGKFANRFIDTPLANLRCGYWQCFTHRVSGFLHWGYNYWQLHAGNVGIDPYLRNDAGEYQAGDGFVIYPPPNAVTATPSVVDSVRHEMMRQGVQDHALFTRLAERADRHPKARRLLAQLRGPLAGDLRHYCRDGEMLERFRRAVGEFLSASKD